MVLKSKLILFSAILFLTIALGCYGSGESESEQQDQVVVEEFVTDEANTDEIPLVELPESFEAFSHIDVVEFQNRLVLLGTRIDRTSGYDIKNEFWVSADGINWNYIQIENQFPPKVFPMMAVIEDNMYIIGGSGLNHQASNDIFSSTDLINWQRNTSKEIFEPRNAGRIEQLQSNYYLIGGEDISFFNDIWMYEHGQWLRLGDTSPIAPWSHRNTRSYSKDRIILMDAYENCFFVGWQPTSWQRKRIDIELYRLSSPNNTNMSLIEYNGIYYFMFSAGSGFSPSEPFLEYTPTDIVYRSTDLENWELLTKQVDTTYQWGDQISLMPFNGLPRQYGHAFLFFNDFFWVIAKEGDIWRSKDCRQWEQVAGPNAVSSPEEG